jgi:ParB family chromosome partitioning protein
VKKLQSPNTGKKSITTPSQDIVNLQTELSDKLGAEVKIQHGSRGSGKLTIRYNSVDELDGILGHLK